ncbi:MAG: hypothetical protein ACLFUP_09345, partial [Desulfobacteraceae bacterium]
MWKRPPPPRERGRVKGRRSLCNDRGNSTIIANRIHSPKGTVFGSGTGFLLETVNASVRAATGRW